MKEVGRRIKALRIANHLTQEQVAKHLGIGKQGVYKYEIGEVTNIPLDNIEKMADLFHVSPCYLSGWSDTESEISNDESRLLDLYHRMNPYGQSLLLDRAEELVILHGGKAQDHLDIKDEVIS